VEISWAAQLLIKSKGLTGGLALALESSDEHYERFDAYRISYDCDVWLLKSLIFFATQAGSNAC
jgi:hypothetical protein